MIAGVQLYATQVTVALSYYLEVRWLGALTAITAHGGEEGFISYIKKLTKDEGDDFPHANDVGNVAATWSDGSLPVDSNCILDENKWSEWTAWDPLNMIEDHQELPPCWIDVGNADQYHIQYGLRRLHARMDEPSAYLMNGTNSPELIVELTTVWTYLRLLVNLTNRHHDVSEQVHGRIMAEGLDYAGSGDINLKAMQLAFGRRRMARLGLQEVLAPQLTYRAVLVA